MVAYCTVCNNRAFPSEAALQQHSRDSPKHRTPPKVQRSGSAATAKTQPPPTSSSASISEVKAVPATPQVALGPIHCKICRLNFSTKVELSSHYKSGDSSWHPKCIRCGEGFEDRGSLNFHTSWAHPMKLCVPCQKYVYLSDMEKHLAQTPLHSPYECAPCNVRFVSVELLKRHYRDGDSKLHPVCHKCSEGFRDEDDLLVHSESMHPSIFCDVCNVNVAEEDLGRHWTESPNHPTCSACDVSFESDDTFTQHLFEVHPELCCRACTFATNAASGLQEHFNTTLSHPKCPTCNIGFSTAVSLQKHVCLVLRQARPPATQTQVASPPVVVERSSSWSSISTLQDHIKRTSTGKPLCERCDRSFKDDASLKQHYRDHSAHPTCRSCNVGFKDAAAYDSHMSSMHPPPPSYSPQQGTGNAVPAAADSRPELESPASEAADPPTVVEQPEAGVHDISGEVEEATAPSALSTPRSESNVPECPVLEIPPPVTRACSEPPLSSVFAPSVRGIGDMTGEGATVRQSSEPQNWPDDPTTEPQDYVGDASTRVPSPPLLSTTVASESSVTPSPTLTPQALPTKLEPIMTSPVPTRPPSIFSPPVRARDASPRESPRQFSFRWGGSSRVSESTSAPGSPGSARSLLFSRAAPPVSVVQTEGEQRANVSGNDNINPPTRASRAPSIVSTSSSTSSSSRHRAKSAHAEATVTPTTTTTSRTHIEDEDVPLQAPSSRTASEPSHEQKPAAARSNTMDAPPSRPVLSWDCRVCAHPPTAPTTTLCGHLFCLSCIMLELQKHGQCPVCRRPVLVRLHVEA